MKPWVWFAAGMAFGEFVLRWVIHAIYLAIIAGLTVSIFLR